jgi:hypothetical protein
LSDRIAYARPGRRVTYWRRARALVIAFGTGWAKIVNILAAANQRRCCDRASNGPTRPGGRVFQRRRKTRSNRALDGRVSWSTPAGAASVVARQLAHGAASRGTRLECCCREHTQERSGSDTGWRRPKTETPPTRNVTAALAVGLTATLPVPVGGWIRQTEQKALLAA